MILKDTSLTTLLPQIHKLAAIALTIPITTANCERGFSAVKRIKTIVFEIGLKLKRWTIS